jgi:hypothetical protein
MVSLRILAVNLMYTYTLITRLLLSQVTWNQVQGFTRELSQLCKTFPGSVKLVFKAYKASPVDTKWQLERKNL